MVLMIKRYNLKHNKYFLAAKLVCLAAFPLWLISIPKSSFDDHSQTLCLFTLLTDIECYGCGLTRACIRLINLDFVGAWNFNKVSFIVFPILCFLLLQEFILTSKKFYKAYQSS
ncbi:DUF2752 domain-containing protein [Pedobacter glucosidilyticus]|uniref:DUF2752 domain-containing protein n=1 Tax=Pedobacter glucosidilyticus TaxID=1122941 RepID=UPI0039C9C313